MTILIGRETRKELQRAGMETVRDGDASGEDDKKIRKQKDEREN